MGKYEPLTRYLSGLEDDSVAMDFTQVEGVLGFSLPQSAFQYPAWWANEKHGSHSHSRGWQDAGFETRQVDTTHRTVRFERKKRPVEPVASTPDGQSVNALWEKAHRLSGIADREALLKAALTALIRREAARQFAEISGTMPDFTVPARERPEW